MSDTCPQCGKPLMTLSSTQWKICTSCQLNFSNEFADNLDSTTFNNSGQGGLFDKSFPVPPEIKGWNWGAFLLGIFWCFDNQVWFGVFLVTLSIFIPCFKLPILILLGFKGNEWAWKSRWWGSIEQFKLRQKQWASAGFFFFTFFFTIGFIYGLFF